MSLAQLQYFIAVAETGKVRAAASLVRVAQPEAFVAVAHEGCVTRAAAALGTTQPALTRRVQRLEGALGTTLFVRGRGMSLSRHGDELLGHARAIVARMREAIVAVRSARAPEPS